MILRIVAAACVLCATTASARTWRILADGSGNAATIQAAIDSAANGDTVLVGRGIYFENLEIVEKDLVLQSESGSEATVLDGSGNNDTVIYLECSTRKTVIEGFTIMGGIGRPGLSSSPDGGGIYLKSGASPVIRNNKIVQNGVAGETIFGGAIVAVNSPSSPLIEANLFEGNAAELGGAIAVPGGESVINHNTFRANSSITDGGAIYLDLASGSVTITWNQFWNNTAGDHGGALHVGGSNQSTLLLEWNLFAKNQAHGSAMDHAAGGAIRIANVQGTVANNTIVENIGPTWTSCGGGGLSLQSPPAGLHIFSNILALNTSCAITCLFESQNELGSNIFWMNTGGDFGVELGTCPSQWVDSQIFADPLFCGPGSGNYTVSISSPALNEAVTYGVWTSPGCGPDVQTREITWGKMKALFHLK